MLLLLTITNSPLKSVHGINPARGVMFTMERTWSWNEEEALSKGGKKLLQLIDL